MGKEIKFRPATFYLGIADMLAREVEGQDQDQVDRNPHDDKKIEKPKVGPGVELEEHPGKSPTEEHTATSTYPSKPDLIPPLLKTSWHRISIFLINSIIRVDNSISTWHYLYS